jgi:hypothetical protein
MFYVLNNEWDNCYLIDYEMDEIWFNNDYSLIEGNPVKNNMPKIKFYLKDSNKITDILANEWGYLILNNKVKEILIELEKDNIQIIDIDIIDKKNTKMKYQYYLINILNRIEAVDFNKSKLEIDGYGFINRIFSLQIDEKKVKNVNIFRLNEYPSFLIVNDKIKKSFEKSNISGIKYILSGNFKI